MANNQFNIVFIAWAVSRKEKKSGDLNENVKFWKHSSNKMIALLLLYCDKNNNARKTNGKNSEKQINQMSTEKKATTTTHEFVFYFAFSYCLRVTNNIRFAFFFHISLCYWNKWHTALRDFIVLVECSGANRVKPGAIMSKFYCSHRWMHIHTREMWKFNGLTIICCKNIYSFVFLPFAPNAMHSVQSE